jgi:hypothetical protein
LKIRWTAGGVRLRITPTELQSIIAGEPISEVMALTGWAVWVVPTEDETSLIAHGPALTLALSRADASRLAEPDQEGVYFQQEADIPLRYLIEKDFSCVHPHAAEALEPPTETFAEPPGFRERKGVC